MEHGGHYCFGGIAACSIALAFLCTGIYVPSTTKLDGWVLDHNCTVTNYTSETRIGWCGCPAAGSAGCYQCPYLYETIKVCALLPFEQITCIIFNNQGDPSTDRSVFAYNYIRSLLGKELLDSIFNCYYRQQDESSNYDLYPTIPKINTPAMIGMIIFYIFFVITVPIWIAWAFCKKP